MNEAYQALVGKEGETVTDLRPVGTVRIDNSEYSAISNAQFIKKGTKVEVEQVDGTRILVKQTDDVQ